MPKLRDNEILTHQRLKELLEYDPETGLWRWLVSGGNRNIDWHPGSLHVKQTGYQYYSIQLDGIKYKASRLAWFYVNGVWPISQIDHKDRNSLNNVWTNLREATHTQNLHNVEKHCGNTTGFKGVSFHRLSRKYRAQIRIEGVVIDLGCYPTAEEASYAYEAVAIPYHADYHYKSRLGDEVSIQ